MFLQTDLPPTSLLNDWYIKIKDRKACKILINVYCNCELITYIGGKQVHTVTVFYCAMYFLYLLLKSSRALTYLQDVSRQTIISKFTDRLKSWEPPIFDTTYIWIIHFLCHHQNENHLWKKISSMLFDLTLRPCITHQKPWFLQKKFSWLRILL